MCGAGEGWTCDYSHCSGNANLQYLIIFPTDENGNRCGSGWAFGCCSS